MRSRASSLPNNSIARGRSFVASPTTSSAPMSRDDRGTRVRIVDTPLVCGPLARAGVAGETPRDWYPEAPRGVDAWRMSAKKIAAHHTHWLTPLRPAFGRGAELLDRVANGGVVVTT